MRFFTRADTHGGAPARVIIIMPALKWSDFISMGLPGAVAVFAIAPWWPPFWELVSRLNDASLTLGVAFLFTAAIAGGVLEALTRVTWEKYVLMRRCEPPDVLSRLTVANLPLYERSVDNSYKYVTFYANLAWAALLTAVTAAWKPDLGGAPVACMLLAIALLLLCASFVQWTYFVNYQRKVFAPRSQTYVGE